MAASATAAYLWEDPGDSIAVHIGLDVVERLGAAVQQGLGPGPRGLEIGGVLLGHTASGGRKVLIEDFWLVPSEHLRGASYTLSPKDRHALAVRLARRSAADVVGYFRSHTRPGLYLDQDDFAIFSSYFPDPSQVFLVVRPSSDGPAVGGFFFWEDGDINRRSPYRQFPFDSQRLLAGDFPIADQPAPRLAPAPIPQAAAARIQRRAPQVHGLAVPIIAGLFLVAGLFVSQHRAPQPAPVPVKASAPASPVVPEERQSTPATPDTPQVEPPQPPAVTEVAQNPPATPDTPQAEQPQPPAPTRRAIAKRTRPKHLPAPAPAPITAARSAPREIEPPPTLAAPITQTELASMPPPRAAPILPPPEAEVSYTSPHPSVFRRVLHKIPTFGAESADAFVPPSPVRKVSPALPRGAAAERSVDVKVYIDESGNVSRAQLLTKRTGLADASLSAARQWRFAPARKRDKPVSSEMVLHFRFGGALAVD
ncbi:MAG: energy transducer TonB [Bryobacteraceae bacterium]|jgi:TonB family protein